MFIYYFYLCSLDPIFARSGSGFRDLFFGGCYTHASTNEASNFSCASSNFQLDLF
ncbi:hypothetical protein HanIR_Chr01g0021151 [Helianthus annuus]|nr:hypothetical protein HanIR_Chr01g0021151 [Helianthus annuus]